MVNAVFFTKNKLQILSKLPNILFTFFLPSFAGWTSFRQLIPDPFQFFN